MSQVENKNCLKFASFNLRQKKYERLRFAKFYYNLAVCYCPDCVGDVKILIDIDRKKHYNLFEFGCGYKCINPNRNFNPLEQQWCGDDCLACKSITEQQDIEEEEEDAHDAIIARFIAMSVRPKFKKLIIRKTSC